MKALTMAAACAALLTLGHAGAAAAQSDILLRLRSGSPLGDRFRVDSASGFVARGAIGIGIIPQTGAGDRLMWHPFKAAFRTGGVSATAWDDANVGFYSAGLGFDVQAAGNYSLAAGYGARTGGSYATSSGYNTNAGGVGTVALGYLSTATNNYGVAIGYRASTNNFQGAIVLNDASNTDSLLASAQNQFSVRAAGGIRLFTNATKTVGVQVAAGGTSWAVISDRNRKEGFLPVDGEDLLARLRSVPVSTWRLKTEEDRTTRHIGPMAQDWHAAFGFTADSTMINLSDFDGVNLAAIEALERRTAQQADQLRALQAENATLRAQLDAQREQNAHFEERLRALEHAAGAQR